MKKYKSKIIKYKYVNKYELKFYIPEKYDQITDFILYHLNQKLKQTKYFHREFSNKLRDWNVLVIEDLTEKKAQDLKKYIDKMFGDFFNG